MDKIFTFIKGIKGIIEGLFVTLKQFFSKGSTIPYPEKKPYVAKRWRGVHGLFLTENFTDELCVSCHLCASVCPSVCITLEGHPEDNGKKKLHRFDVDLGRCIYCGFCEEVCPVDAIRLTTSFDYSVRSREDFVLSKEDLLKIGKANMKKGENGALGCRRADGDKVTYNENRNYNSKPNRYYLKGAVE